MITGEEGTPVDRTYLSAFAQNESVAGDIEPIVERLMMFDGHLS